MQELFVGQKVLFKIQLKNHIEYYRSYPFTVNKVSNVPEIVDKYIPQGLGEQSLESYVKLSDLIFGDDLPEVSQIPYVTPDLPNVTNEKIHEWNGECSVKRCLDFEFEGCDDVNEDELKNKQDLEFEGCDDMVMEIS